MPSIIETLEQETMWYGQDGYPYRVADMEQSHRHNTLAFLRRRAHDLYERAEWRACRAVATAPNYANAIIMLESHRRVLAQSPLSWLNGKPLVRALERAIKLHDAIEPEKLELES